MHRECRAKFSNCMRPDVDAPWIAQASSPQVSGASELAIQFSALWRCEGSWWPKNQRDPRVCAHPCANVFHSDPPLHKWVKVFLHSRYRYSTFLGWNRRQRDYILLGFLAHLEHALSGHGLWTHDDMCSWVKGDMIGEDGAVLLENHCSHGVLS